MKLWILNLQSLSLDFILFINLTWLLIWSSMHEWDPRYNAWLQIQNHAKTKMIIQFWTIYLYSIQSYLYQDLDKWTIFLCSFFLGRGWFERFSWRGAVGCCWLSSISSWKMDPKTSSPAPAPFLMRFLLHLV